MPRKEAIRGPSSRDLLVGHLPDAHAVGGEAGAAVVEDRRDAAQQAALAHPPHVLEQRVAGHAERLRPPARRARRRPACRPGWRGSPRCRARRRAAARSSSGSVASPALASASVSPSISRSMRILNSFSVGSWRIDSAPVSCASTSSVPSSPSCESGSVAIVNHMLNSWLRR